MGKNENLKVGDRVRLIAGGMPDDPGVVVEWGMEKGKDEWSGGGLVYRVRLTNRKKGRVEEWPVYPGELEKID